MDLNRITRYEKERKKKKKEVLAKSFIISSYSPSENQQIGLGQNLISAVGEVVLSQILGGFARLKPNLRPLTSSSAEALLTFTNPHDDSGAARGWRGGKKLTLNSYEMKAHFILCEHSCFPVFEFGGKVAVPTRATQAELLFLEASVDGCG